ncbi:MAG: acyl-CoA dehydrogenase family protein [Actinobacteria bacterium]|nr:acyl-CoA dehydrogenase family protein [Actinomycetota bacterium]
MELEFSAEQEELRDGVRTVLTSECPPSLARGIVEARLAGDHTTATGLAGGLWTQIVELGWAALTVPETAGGLGLGLVELAVVVEEAGRALAPTPLLPTISQLVPAIRECGSRAQHEALLRPVAERGATGTLAVAEAGGGTDPAATTATATPQPDGGYVLDGSKHFVMEASAATEVVVVARTPGSTGDDGVGAFVVPAGALAIRPFAELDPSRELATVGLDGVSVPADRVLGTPGPATAAALRRAVEEATVALALESVGTAQTVFDISLEYAKQREQFGVPIGSFQAIKHKFADMLVLLERARALGYFAALTIAEDDERHTLATSMAKAAAGDAIARIAKEGIQVHGGIGYTWEHDMHLYVRRLESDAVLFGGATAHRAVVADLIGV